MANTNDSSVLYDEDKTNPNDVNQTYQTTNTDGSILDEYRVSDTNTNRYANTPNTTTEAKDSATGSGLTAAKGTEYSWETSAKERANLDYQADVLEAKQNMLENRQTLESQGQQYQEQLDMQKYSQNQSNEKVGWTGGYILDTERQMSYLKQTIQSQMYGSMELQRYGYDTSLAAARLAYDTNKYDLALEYYNTALSRAVSEAEITGYYVSPETSEMLDQYSMASRTLNDETATEENKQRADKILASVYEWFEANGISKQGVETYTHLVEERTYKQSIESAIEYADQATKQWTDTNTFTKLDANGNTIYKEDGSVETINFQTMSQADLIEYIGTSEQARQQYYGYLDTKITSQTEDQFKTWLISKDLMDKDDEGNYTPKSNIDYEQYLYSYLKTSDIYQSIIESFDTTDLSDSDIKLLTNIYENWDFEVNLPDGSSIVKSFKELQNEAINIKNLASTESLKEVLAKDDQGNYINNYDFTKKTISFDGTTSETIKVTDDLIFWSVQVTNLRSSGGIVEDDFKLSNGIGDGYNLELATSSNEIIQGLDINEIKETYKRAYGTDMPSGSCFIYKDELYIYHAYTDSKQTNRECFYRAKGQCKGKAGKKGTYSDLVSRIKENS